MSLKDSILNACDRAKEPVDVSEYWPEAGTVYVSVMSGADRDRYEFCMRDALNKKEHIVALLLVRTIVVEKGERVFADEDAGELGKKSWRVLDKLWDVARRLNRLREEDGKELEKN